MTAIVTSGDDERQFVRAAGDNSGAFIRRDITAEAAAFETLRQEGFLQMRVADSSTPKGRRVFVFRGRDSGERWHRFVNERVPILESLGFRSMIEGEFGPRLATAGKVFDVKVADAQSGSFSLDFGIEIDGVRRPLLPILSHLHARGGMATATVVGDELITSLEDGRVVKTAGRAHRPATGDHGRPARSRRAHHRRDHGAVRCRGADGAGAGGRAGDALAGRRVDRGACRPLPRPAGTAARHRAGPRSMRICAPTSFRASPGCKPCWRAGWADCWPTTWGWARPRRPSPTSSSNTPPGACSSRC